MSTDTSAGRASHKLVALKDAAEQRASIAEATTAALRHTRTGARVHARARAHAAHAQA